MKKTTQQSWSQQSAAWKESGLSQAEFCRQAGLPYRKFRYHCRRTEAPVPTENVFVPPAQLSSVLACYNAGTHLSKKSGVVIPWWGSNRTRVRVLHKKLVSIVVPAGSAMLNLGSSSNIFLLPGPTDMRKAINGLAQMVADHTVYDVLGGAFFIFCNKSSTIVSTE